MSAKKKAATPATAKQNVWDKPGKARRLCPGCRKYVPSPSNTCPKCGTPKPPKEAALDQPLLNFLTVMDKLEELEGRGVDLDDILKKLRKLPEDWDTLVEVQQLAQMANGIDQLQAIRAHRAARAARRTGTDG